MLLDTVGRKFILKKDKYNTFKSATKHRKTDEDQYYIYILILDNYRMKI